MNRPRITMRPKKFSPLEKNPAMAFGMERTAVQIAKNYELKRKNKKDGAILKNFLRANVLKSMDGKTSEEERLLKLCRAIAELQYAYQHASLKKMPLAETEKIYASALDIVNEAITSTGIFSSKRKNFRDRANSLRESLTEIRKARNDFSASSSEIDSDWLNGLLMLAGDRINRLRGEKGIRENTWHVLEEIEIAVNNWSRGL